MNDTDTSVRYHVLDTGYCLASEHQVIVGGQRKQFDCHALAALIQHPREGWLLWDTGYAPHMLDETRRLPFSLYRRITPLRLRPELAVAAQLERFGLSPADIRHVIISHFHADHVAGLRDFPRARFVASQAAYEHTARLRGFGALLRGVVPALLPSDFAERATLLPRFTGAPLPGLGPTHDLFGDGTLLLVDLPGHARGQIGMLAQTERGRVLFAADGCWLSRSYRERRPPSGMAALIADDRRAVQTTLNRIHAFAEACPDVNIIPTHCPEAFRREVATG